MVLSLKKVLQSAVVLVQSGTVGIGVVVVVVDVVVDVVVVVVVDVVVDRTVVSSSVVIM